jgi:hypothetical protein
MKPKKYDHNKGQWKPETYCTVKKCIKKVVTCPEFHRRGHIGYELVQPNEVHIDSNGERWYRAWMKISHAHFVYNNDQGRHIEDFIHNNSWIHENDTYLTRKIMQDIDYKKPDWLQESSN